MKIAVEGCAHGALDTIYEALGHLETVNKIKIDLLIICGDFQAVRNKNDLECMAVPAKYRKMETFYKYHSGEKVAPILTIFIGGNHEASNYLTELFYGGWVCPNIYYMGRAGVIRVNGLRIAGLSGIYKGRDYLKGHFESYPFSEDTKRSVYHVRNLEVFRLLQLKEPVDICLSHDWPRGVYNHGNVKQLLQRKEFLRNEVQSNTLGSRPAESVLKELKPRYWFAAHLHCKFAALVPHDAPAEEEEDSPGKITRFLALDKCLPRRRYLQILDIGPPLDGSKPVLEHDPEWLAVLSLTNHLMSLTRQEHYMPGPGSPERYQFTPTEEEKKEACSKLDSLIISPGLFQKTAASHDTQNEGPFPQVNPQTQRLCTALGLTDPTSLLKSGKFAPVQTSQNEGASSNTLSSEDEADEVDSGNDDKEEVENKATKVEELSGVEGLFVIDRRKSSDTSLTSGNQSTERRRSKLVLCAPKMSSDVSELDVSVTSTCNISGTPSTENSEGDVYATPDSSFLDFVNSSQANLNSSAESSELDVDNSSKRLNTNNPEVDSSVPIKRQMKRRNLEFYTSNDDDCS